MPLPSSILDYSAPEALPAAHAVRRFQVIYAIGIVAAYVMVGICWRSWPHTSNLADPRKAVLAMTIQITGGMACVWLALAMHRILRTDAIQRSIWTWLLVVANVFAILTILPISYT